MPHPGWAAFSFEGIGTRWEISTPEQLGPGIRQELLGTVADYDHTYSRFRRDSLVSKLAAAPGAVTLPWHAGA